MTQCDTFLPVLECNNDNWPINVMCKQTDKHVHTLAAGQTGLVTSTSIEIQAAYYTPYIIANNYIIMTSYTYTT